LPNAKRRDVRYYFFFAGFFFATFFAAALAGFFAFLAVAMCSLLDGPWAI
jgi:hypothetical protein